LRGGRIFSGITPITFTVSFTAPTGPTIVAPAGGRITITEGSEKIVKCVARAAPKPSLAWYRNDKQLNITNCTKDPKSCENIDYEVYIEGDDSAAHTSYTTGVLKLRSALYPRDQARFKCVASNGVQPPAELILDFNIQGKLSLVWFCKVLDA